MSFLKRLKPISGSMTVDVGKESFQDNADLSGVVIVNSKEEIDADEVRAHLHIQEVYQEKRMERGNEFIEERFRDLHKETIRLSGAVKIKVGENKFPFNIRIPPLTLTTPKSGVILSLEGVLNVQKRPDMSRGISLPLQREAQVAVLKPGMLLDELYSDVGEVAEDVRSVDLNRGQTVRLHAIVESGGPFELLVLNPDGEIMKTFRGVTKEHKFELAISRDGGYGFSFQSVGKLGAVRLKVSSNS